MGIDFSSIANMKPVNLAEIYGAAGNVKAQNMQNQVMQQQINQAQKSQVEQEAMKNAFVVNPDGSVDEQKTLSNLYGINPQKAMEFKQASTKNNIENSKLQNENSKSQLEQRKALLAYSRERLSQITDQSGYDEFRNELIQLKAPFAASLDPVYSPQTQKKYIMTADEAIKQATPKWEKVELGGKVQFVDTNPATNPSISTMQYNKTASPDSVASDARTQLMMNNTNSQNELNRQNQLNIAGMRQDNSAPVSVLGADGKPVYVNRNEALGKQPYSAAQEAKDTVKTQQNEQARISAQQVLDQADLLFKHAGRNLGTGVTHYSSLIPGTDARGFQANLDTFKAQTFVPMVSALKGMGALSDAEGKKLSESVGALDPSMSSKDFESSLKLVTKTLYEKAKASGLNVSLPEFANDKQSKISDKKTTQSNDDAQAIAWAKANLKDPRAVKILKLHGM